MEYEMETIREIWPTKGDGERIEVGQDREGFECIEIRQKESDDKISARMMFPPELARLVGDALIKCADEITNQPTQ